jgi:hypothetical protein
MEVVHPLYGGAERYPDVAPGYSSLTQIGGNTEILHDKKMDGDQQDCVQIKSASLLLWLPDILKPLESVNEPPTSSSYVAGAGNMFYQPPLIKSFNLARKI